VFGFAFAFRKLELLLFEGVKEERPFEYSEMVSRTDLYVTLSSKSSPRPEMPVMLNLPLRKLVLQDVRDI